MFLLSYASLLIFPASFPLFPVTVNDHGGCGNGSFEWFSVPLFQLLFNFNFIYLYGTEP